MIVAAHDEAERIGATLTALAGAFPQARVWVADDGSRDATGAIARAAGATVVRSERVIGKGAAMSAAARAALDARTAGPARLDGEPVAAPSELAREQPEPTGAPSGSAAAVYLLCDGDLAESASALGPLVQAVRDGRADLAVAVFAQRVGGGFGIALGFARWAIRRRCGLVTAAPISGQRALGAGTLEQVLPFAAGYGMELGMTIDAVRAGSRVLELELELSHRAGGRSLAGFAHRARQLADFVRAYARRR